MKNSPSQQGPYANLEEVLGYTFKDGRLLEQCLTHRSLLNEISEPDRRDNERLEFLGDAVLGFLIAEFLMQEFPEEQEGELTRMRSSLVKEKRLAEMARDLDLGKYLFLGKGEDRMGGREKPSVLADAFEAVVAAIYLDGGDEAARQFVQARFGALVESAKRGDRILDDSKTRIQELLQALFRESPVYEVVEELGPDHAKTFVVQLRIKDLVLGSGEGKSKKDAEQDAARRFLKELEANPLGML